MIGNSSEAGRGLSPLVSFASSWETSASREIENLQLWNSQWQWICCVIADPSNAQGAENFLAFVSLAELVKENIFDLLERCEPGSKNKRQQLTLGMDVNGKSYVKGGFTHDVLLKNNHWQVFLTVKTCVYSIRICWFKNLPSYRLNPKI